jgi:hypothetical protein
VSGQTARIRDPLVMTPQIEAAYLHLDVTDAVEAVADIFRDLERISRRMDTSSLEQSRSRRQSLTACTAVAFATPGHSTLGPVERLAP